ncbi:MAG: nicotinate (nicotinamide) nucleotide adenylyltransferase [Bullifex sp.]|nr:nicotinate (nicotinamide) nucleotide adenylyltransferase [Spirochaetales bacterium]MDY5776910.1 nicotinate (nicotinamide) nucleotide adenylyltransferase [Bullifex sp.]
MPTTEMKSKLTCIFGGTFDPIHKGHLHLLHQLEENTPYERVIIIPARISNFKQDTHPTSAIDRYNMVKIALKEYSTKYPSRLELAVSDIEIKRGGVSYTYDTVIDVMEKWPITGRLGILMGDDLLEGLDRWYRAEELKELVDFVCFSRDGVEVPKREGYRIRMINAPVYQASSTSVRSGDLSQLTDGVREYVEAHGLYRT